MSMLRLVLLPGTSVAALCCAAALGHDSAGTAGTGGTGGSTGREVVNGTARTGVVARPVPIVTMEADDEEATLYHNGETILTEWTAEWRPMCNSDRSGITSADVLDWATVHMENVANLDPDEIIVIDEGPNSGDAGGLAGAGLNLVFNIGSGVPSAALSAIAAV